MEPVEINNVRISLLRKMLSYVEVHIESNGRIETDIAHTVLELAKAYRSLYEEIDSNTLNNNLEKALLRKMLSIVKRYFSTNRDRETQADAADVVLKLAKAYKKLSVRMNQSELNNLQQSLLVEIKLLLNTHIDIAGSNVLLKLVKAYRILFKGSNEKSFEYTDAMFVDEPSLDDDVGKTPSPILEK